MAEPDPAPPPPKTYSPEEEKLRRQQQWASAVRTVMRHKHGRRLVLTICRRGRYLTSGELSKFLAGRRSLALELYNEVRAVCPELMFQAEEEDRALQALRAQGRELAAQEKKAAGLADPRENG